MRATVEGKIIAADCHRNGVGGEPFTVGIVREHRTGTRYLVVTFGDKYQTAVFDIDKLAEGDIAFGSNSWRGDVWAHDWRDELLKAAGVHSDDEVVQ